MRLNVTFEHEFISSNLRSYPLLFCSGCCSSGNFSGSDGLLWWRRSCGGMWERRRGEVEAWTDICGVRFHALLARPNTRSSIANLEARSEPPRLLSSTSIGRRRPGFGRLGQGRLLLSIFYFLLQKYKDKTMRSRNKDGL